MAQQTSLEAELIAKIRELVSADQLDDALQLLAGNEACQQEALLLTQRLIHNHRAERLGTITPQDARVERTRIAAAILASLQTTEPLFRRTIWRAYRSWKTISMVILVTGVLLLILAPRHTWGSYARFDLETRTFYNTGNMLLASGHFTQKSCLQSPKGVWFRPLEADAKWQASEIADVLCLLERDPPELTDIVAFASLPLAPETVYALTAHNGVLVSTNSGRSFTLHPAGLLPLPSHDERDLLRVSGTKENPIIWVGGSTMTGLYRTENNQWQRVDDDGLCQGLPAMKVISLLITSKKILIGSSEQGLWMSDNGGKDCRRVFDSTKKYDFHGIWDVSKTNERFLLLVQNRHVDGIKESSWNLLLLCPVPGSCTDDAEWQIDGTPIWSQAESIGDVLVTQDGQGNYAWYGITEVFPATVYHGDLESGDQTVLTRLYRCFPFCDPVLVWNSQEANLYLLAGGYEFHLDRVGWWRQFWP